MIRITLKNGSVFETPGEQSRIDDIFEMLKMEMKSIRSGPVVFMVSEISTVEHIPGPITLTQQWQVKEGTYAV